MLDVRLFQMQTFLPMPYEDALAAPAEAGA